MPESTPDRLKAFRAEYDARERRSKRSRLVILAAFLLGVAGVFAYQLLIYGQLAPDSKGPATTNASVQRDLAAYLAAKNQPEAALEAYEQYLEHAEMAPADRAKVCYSAANLAIDTGRHQKALALLYQAEMLDPNSELRNDIDKKILLCLDKLGRPESLRRELARRGNPRHTAAASGPETVLAEFGEERITHLDLERELEKLPASAREALNTRESRVAFLKNLVAERLLVEKARRLGLDKDPAIQEQLAGQMERLMVRKLIDDEVRSRLSVTPQDIERFYKAEIARFTVPPTATGTVGRGATESEALANAAGEGAVRAAVRDGRLDARGIPADAGAHLAQAVLAKGPGEIAVAVEAGSAWYAFRGTLVPETVQPFEQVRDEAERLYRMQKEQEELAAFIEGALNAEGVRLYPERLAPEEAAP